MTGTSRDGKKQLNKEDRVDQREPSVVKWAAEVAQWSK